MMISLEQALLVLVSRNILTLAIKLKNTDNDNLKSQKGTCWRLTCYTCFAPAGGVCRRRHGNSLHTGRSQLLREGREQWQEARRDHPHADCGRRRDRGMRRVIACALAPNIGVSVEFRPEESGKNRPLECPLLSFLGPAPTEKPSS